MSFDHTVIFHLEDVGDTDSFLICFTGKAGDSPTEGEYAGRERLTIEVATALPLSCTVRFVIAHGFHRYGTEGRRSLGSLPSSRNSPSRIESGWGGQPGT